MSPEPPDRLDDLSDDELAAIERDLLEAARSHRIELERDEADHVSEGTANAAMDEAARARLEDLERRADAFLNDAGISLVDLHFSGSESPSHEQRELDAKFDRIESTAAKARQTRHTRLAKEVEKKDQDQSAAIGLGIGMSFMFAMIGMLLVGLLVGFLIDRSNGTSVWRGYGAVIGASLGMLFGLYQLNRFQNRL